ncbi:MAG: XRE family transcriptional regulator [Candidatus Hydrogenedens sp.]|nr:helix-turn-helix transcriptional regulator [Candidatus Hydrogenedentota bacterium]NLF58409.1 XRE family transcriptional regulator [Candidatus Hydrogenedens sp.]
MEITREMLLSPAATAWELLASAPTRAEYWDAYERENPDWSADPAVQGARAKALFVEQLHGTLKSRGLSPADFARLLGKSRAYVSRLLNEQENMTIATMACAAAALGMKLDLLLSTPGTVFYSVDREQTPHVAVVEHWKVRGNTQGDGNAYPNCA